MLDENSHGHLVSFICFSFFLTLRQTALAASRQVVALLGLVQQRKSSGVCPKRTPVEKSQWKQGCKESTHKPRSHKNTLEKMHCMYRSAGSDIRRY